MQIKATIAGWNCLVRLWKMLNEFFILDHLEFDTIMDCVGCFTHTKPQNCFWNTIKWLYRINTGRVGVTVPSEIFLLRLGEYKHCHTIDIHLIPDNIIENLFNIFHNLIKQFQPAIVATHVCMYNVSNEMFEVSVEFYLGCLYNPLLFIIIMEALSWEERVSCPRELLSGTLNHVLNKFKKK